MYLDTKEKKQCCGCMACSQICPVSAIEMQTDEKGFAYPKVDAYQCINCGLCRKVCPLEDNYVGCDADPDVYALQAKKPEILKESSSGGMFTLLARWVLDRAGVIYGVAFDESFQVRHERAETWEKAAAFRTSKYVESDLTEVYRSIRTDLEQGRTVLLTGTPCQIMGVKKYLRLKQVNRDNLYTCDNICHGVPSRKVWGDYLNILRGYLEPGDEILRINMRSKKVSWKKQVMDVKVKRGSLDKVVDGLSFNRMFLSLYSNRPSCFDCHYTSYKRPGDFTLGDFWNVEQARVSFDPEGGVNVVLVNSTKGKLLFEELKKQAEFQKVTKKDCWQPHLEYSAKPPANQEAFWQEYRENTDKEAVIRKYMKGSPLTRLIRTVSPILRRTGLYQAAGKMYKLVVVGKKGKHE